MLQKLKEFVYSKYAAAAGLMTAVVAVLVSDPGLAHAQAVTLDATQSADISSATGSIPTTAASFILSSFQAVLPYILLLVGLFVAYRIIMHFVKRGH